MRKKITTLFILLLACCAYGWSSDPIRVACVGNSITYGIGVADMDKDSYPAQLQQLLGEGYHVERFGKPGACLMKKSHRPFDQQPEYQAALDYKPEIAVIHLGVNDTDPRDWGEYADEFVTDYLALINAFRQVNPDMRIIIARITPLTVSHRMFQASSRDWRLDINEAIETVAELANVELIDYEHPLLYHPNLMPDSVHPNEIGCSFMAEEAYQAITGNYGGLSLPITYTSGMVLQRNKPLPIQGKSDANLPITVKLGDNEYRTVANAHGDWEVVIPPMPEAVGLVMTVTNGKDTIQYDDVAVGEVWMASGQSNMAFRLDQDIEAAEQVAAAEDSLLRFFTMEPRALTYAGKMSDEALDSIDKLKYYLPAKWERSTPEAAKKASAVAYYFARKLRDSLDVPVGIIGNAIGGSGTEAWISVETLHQEMPGVMANWTSNYYLMPWVQERALDNMGKDLKHRHPYEPTYLFTTGVMPLGQYPIAGVLWYQGESNAHNVELHEKLFPLVVKSFRDYWEDPNLPLYYVQLSSINRNSWPRFRDSQRRLLQEIPNSGMAVSSDYGDPQDVHPRHKRPVGERLAAVALNKTYGNVGVVPSGPLPLRAYVDGDKIVLEMEYSEGLATSDQQPLRTIEIAEFEDDYHKADAQIIDNKIYIDMTNIQNPRFIRYAWQPYTDANLVNGAGLPASTFKIEIDEPLPAESGLESGISGAFAAFLGTPVVAGGCNFPVNPMAPGSQKKFYEGIYAIQPASEDMTTAVRIGSLPTAMAYGASVVADGKWVLIGGSDGAKSLNNVWAADQDFNFTALPSLPYAIDNMAAATVGNKIYVAGGSVDGVPGNELLMLDLDNQAKGWQQLKPFPGNPRVQPVMAAGKNAKGEECLWLFGGFAGKHNGKDATLNTDGLCYNISKGKWTAVNGPVDAAGEPVSLGGGVAAAMPDGRIVAAGGVNKDVFLAALQNQAPDYLSHPIDWYSFNGNVFIFDPAAQQWSIKAASKDAARAGASITVAPDGSITLIGGELKPRIRASRHHRL